MKPRTDTVPHQSSVSVRQYVVDLARQHRVSYTRTFADEWAEAATRLAGDDVQSDETADLLVALKRAHKVTDSEMTVLLVNHLRERKGV
jgi:hypothetical protein